MISDHLIAGLPPPLHFWDFNRPRPGVQLCQWLVAEGRRSVAADPKSNVADLMGAAMLLGSVYSGLQQPDSRQQGLALWSQRLRGDGELEPSQDPFDQAFEMSRELARKATELEPNQNDWWRLQAIIMFRLSQPNGVREFPIDAAALQNAQSHDPNNAIYEYLLGADSLRHAEVRKLQGEPLVVGHPDLLADCKVHYAAAISKPMLATGESHASCVAQFLDDLHGPAEFKLGACRLIHFDGLRAIAIRGIEPFVNQQVQVRGPGGIELLKLESNDQNHEIVAWLLEQRINTKWIDQWHASGETGVDVEALDPRSQLNTRYDKFASSKEMTKRQKNVNAYFSLMASEQTVGQQKYELSKIWSAIAVATAAIGWLMLIGGAIGLLSVGWLTRRRVSPKLEVAVSEKLPYVKAILIWFAVFGLTFAFFGILPAYESPLRPYHWWFAAATAVIVFVPAIILIWLAARFVFRQGRLPSSRRSIHYQPMRWGSSIASALLLAAIPFTLAEPNMRSWIYSLAQCFPESIVENCGLIGNGNAASALSGRLDINQWYSPTWAIVQWGVHAGLFWTTGIWLAIMLLLNPTREGCLRTSRFAIRFGIVMLFVALAAATQWTEIVRTRYDRELTKLADPTWLNKTVEAEIQKIENSGG